MQKRSGSIEVKLSMVFWGAVIFFSLLPLALILQIILSPPRNFDSAMPPLLLGGTFLAGVIIVAWLFQRNFPKVVDDDGITTRGGKRYRWSDITSVQRTRVTAAGARVSGGLVLGFGKSKVMIVPMHLQSSERLLDFVEQKVGTRSG